MHFMAIPFFHFFMYNGMLALLNALTHSPVLLICCSGGWDGDGNYRNVKVEFGSGGTNRMNDHEERCGDCCDWNRIDMTSHHQRQLMVDQGFEKIDRD
jgi:hypothetical protein